MTTLSRRSPASRPAICGARVRNCSSTRRSRKSRRAIEAHPRRESPCCGGPDTLRRGWRAPESRSPRDESRGSQPNRAHYACIGVRTRGRRNDQHRHLAGCAHWQAQIDPAAAADDYVQRNPAFAQRFAKLQIFIRELGRNCGGRPYVRRVGGERTRADDHHVRNGAQQAHHHAILVAESADVGAAGVSLLIERDDAVERSHKIAVDMWMCARQRHAQGPAQARQVGRQRQRLATLRFE
jgi:hypothetical protein